MSKILGITLIAIFFVLGVGFGYAFTPEYSALKSSPSHGKGLGEADKYLNLRFINGMIAHHMSAIDMLEQVKNNSNRQELKDLADAVIKIDTDGIKHLYELKADMYGDRREIKRFNKVTLGEADKNFDLRFLNAMVIHHEEAIDSSREAMLKSSDQKILDVAGAVNSLLSENLIQLKKWRENWYSL